MTPEEHDQLALEIDFDLYDDGVVRTPQEHVVALVRRYRTALIEKMKPDAIAILKFGVDKTVIVIDCSTKLRMQKSLFDYGTPLYLLEDWK